MDPRMYTPYGKSSFNILEDPFPCAFGAACLNQRWSWVVNSFVHSAPTAPCQMSLLKWSRKLGRTALHLNCFLNFWLPQIHRIVVINPFCHSFSNTSRCTLRFKLDYSNYLQIEKEKKKIPHWTFYHMIMCVHMHSYLTYVLYSTYFPLHF